MEPDLFVPGDQQYQMVNEPLQPMGLETLLPKEETKLPNLGDIAKNVVKNKAITYAAGKLGINPTVASGLTGLLGMGANVFAPLAAVSALSGRSLGISDYLANKRARKSIEKNIQNDPQGNVTTYPTGIMSMQPTAQDTARGTIGSRTTSAPSSVPSSSDRGAALHG